MRPGQFADKRVVVTGASRGIGAEIARKFAAEGASCVLVGRKEELLNGVMGELRGGDHKFLVGDVGMEQFWRAMKKEVRFQSHSGAFRVWGTMSVWA